MQATKHKKDLNKVVTLLIVLCMTGVSEIYKIKYETVYKSCYDFYNLHSSSTLEQMYQCFPNNNDFGIRSSRVNSIIV